MNFKIILVVFFISNVLGATVSMSPPVSRFDLLENEELCNEVIIKTEGILELNGKDLWVLEEKDRKNIKKYNFSSQDLNLDVKYEKDILVDVDKKVTLCLSGKKVGNYSGVLLYRIKGKPVQVGIWIEAQIQDSGILRLTENQNKEIRGVKKRSLLFSFPMLLMTLLLVLIWRLKKNK